MADRIGRADYELRGDSTGLVKDLAAAEQKLTQSGQRVEKGYGGMGTAVKAGAAVAAVGFGLMAKGALEMERAQGNFQAETGRSREEAIAFSKDMNALVGQANTVGVGFDKIASAGTAVAVQFEKTGAEGVALTNGFLTFSKVTGQDATGAVNDFDAALDAWGAPAERGLGLMDQLVASHQKYGTDAGPAATAAIAKMAPALQAMGADLDDAVGLLNLFESAGMDASKAPLALNTAVQKLKPGETLDDLIVQISSIEDPLERAQAAAEIFGTRTGTGLANAIKPGITSLDEFILTAEETEGVAQQASEDMLTTSDKIRMFAEKAGAALRGLGQDFGPVLSGLGGLSTLAMALPRQVTQPLTNALGGVWKAIAGSSAVKVAAGAAGAAAGLAYTAGMKVADLVGTALGGAFNASGLPGSKAYQAAGAGGKVLGAAMGAGLLVGLAAVAAEVSPELNQAASDKGREFFGKFGDEAKGLASGTVLDSAVDGIHQLFYGLLASDPLRSEAQRTWSAIWLEASRAQLDPQPFADEFQRMIDAGTPVEEAKRIIVEKIWTAGVAGGQALGPGFLEGVKFTDIPSVMRDMLPDAAEMGDLGEDIGEAGGLGIVRGWRHYHPEAVRAVQEQVDEMQRVAAWAGALTPREFIQNVRSGFDTVKSAFTDLKTLMKTTLSPVEKEAELIGIATSRRLARALKDGRPEVRSEGQQIALDTIGQLHLLDKESPAIGRLAMKLLAGATAAEAPLIRRAISQITGVAEDELDKLPGYGAESGQQMMTALERAIAARRQGVLNKIHALTGAVKDAILLHSPAKTGPWSEEGGPVAWMEKAGDQIVGGLEGRINAGVPRVAGAVGRLAGAVRMPGDLAGGALAGAGGGGYNLTVGDINITVQGAGGEPGEIGDAVAERVRGVFDDILSNAERGRHLRWSGANG
jgi:hypothetical protein